jgi:flagellar biosynthetic protein FlhB
VADDTDQSEKTEEPSQKKLDDAHERGDVAKSQEIPTLFVLFAATLVVMIVAPYSMSELSRVLTRLVANAHDIPTDGRHLRGLVLQLGLGVAAAVAIPFLAVVLAAVAGNLIQHRPVWSVEPITPKLSKVSPLSGFKRLFSSESLVNFVKGVIKITLVGTAITFVLWPMRDRLDLMIAMDTRALLPQTRDLTIKLLGAVLAVMLIVAALDFTYQRFKWMQRQRMSLKELKDEFKQQEGSPEIKAKVKQIRNERAKRRMMAEVPKATVVVTNPTHYAVALRYEAGMPAPKCVAKGIDAVALRIREVATEAGVTVVENPPLARVLHAAVEIDEEIPPEHYRAVAEVVGYVMNLRRRRRWTAG